jgi:ankyrin repeat protein
LAASGADLNAETKAGYTPLHVACHFGSVNMVRFLLEREVNIDVQVSSLAHFVMFSRENKKL